MLGILCEAVGKMFYNHETVKEMNNCWKRREKKKEEEKEMNNYTYKYIEETLISVIILWIFNQREDTIFTYN